MKNYQFPIIVILFLVLIGVSYKSPVVQNILGSGSDKITQVASTTVISLTTTSKQLLATSSKRTGFSIQPLNCTAAGVVFVAQLKDVAATVTNGYGVLASTTESFNDSWNPASNEAVQGITSVGTCSVSVTEWRNAF